MGRIYSPPRGPKPIEISLVKPAPRSANPRILLLVYVPFYYSSAHETVMADQQGIVGTGPRKRVFPQIRFGSLRFYVVLFAVAVGLHFINSAEEHLRWAQPLPAPELVLDFHKRQLDIWTEMNKLLITLATVTIGAVGGFLLNTNKASPVSRDRMGRAAASWLFSALSLYFGYLSYSQAVSMLSMGTFDAYDVRLWWPTRLQFWSFLVSVLLFADFVYGTIRDKQNPG